MSTSPPSASVRWILLAFLTLLNVVNFVDRQAISSLAVSIKADLGLSVLQIGLLSGYAFATFYSFMGLYLGILSDRVNRIRLIAVGLFLWSLMTALTGLTRNFGEMALARVFVGIGEATLTPAALSMLAEAFPPRQRSLAAGVYYLGIPLGVSLGFFISGTLEPVLSGNLEPAPGWRYCFLIFGIFGVLLTGAVLFFRDPRNLNVAGGETTPVRPSIGFGQVWYALMEIPGVLSRSPALLLTMIGGCMLNIAVGATYFDPIWFESDLHLDKDYALRQMSFYFLLGGVFGNVFGGWFGEWVEHRLKLHRLWAVLLSLAVCVPALIAYRRMHDANSIWFWWLYAIVSVSVTIYYGPVFSTVLELSPNHLKSTMMAFFLIGMNLLGASLGAVIAPILAKLTGSLTTGLLVTGLFSVLAVPLFLAAMKFMKHSQEMSIADT